MSVFLKTSLQSVLRKPVQYGIVQTDKSVAGGVPCVRVMDLTKPSLDALSMITTSEEINKSYAKTILEGDEILFALRGEIGQVSKIPPSLIGANITRGIARLSPLTDKITTDFLFWVMRSPETRSELFRRVNGSALQELPIKELRKIQIRLPGLNEQKLITGLLEKWDRAIEFTERLITEKQLRRKGIMQQLLSGKHRLPGFEKSKEVRHTRYGCYPADWGYPQLGEVAKHVSTKNQDGTTLPVLSCTKHRGLVDSMEYFGKQVFSKDLSTYKVVRRGQFAYATNHIEEGSIGYQNLHDAAAISPMYTVFEAGKKIDDRFLFLLLKTEKYRHIFAVNTSASVDRRGSLRWPEFSRIHVPLPSLDEQGAIVTVINIADSELGLLQAKADALREQKKGLMQQLLTGKKRVKG